LSERRAEVVFGMLIRDVPTWERLFSHHEHTPGDVWGDDAIELMLASLGFVADATKKEKLGDVIREYQRIRGFPITGRNDVALRAKLFAEYMDFLCSDVNGKPFQLTKADFLGEGATHGAFQGCSEFNPRLVLAQSEEDGFKADKVNGKDDRATANFDNRRAIIYFFEKGSKIDPKKWPCPRASDPDKVSKCIAHFWSDGNDRKGLLLADKRRRFGKAVRNRTERIAQVEKTFACRFYHGLALHSPCEGDLQMWVLQLMMDGPHEKGKDVEPIPVSNVRYVVIASADDEAPVIRGTTSANGVIGIPLWSRIASMRLKLDVFSAITGSPAPDGSKSDDDKKKPVKSIDIEAPAPVADDDLSDPFKDEKTFVEFPLFGGNLKRIVLKFPPGQEPISLEPDSNEPPVAPDEQNLGARQRLFNLGYGVAEPQKWTDAQLAQFVKRFQKDKKLKETGALDKDTIDRLREEYGS
ncbi:MAG TPA: peptidoglycan-binding domain-containing protein, partial [Thermoanaerobaculia bacterium]